MSRPFVKSFTAAAVVDPYLIVKAAAPATGTTVQAGAAASDPLVGITDAMGGVSGRVMDVTLAGPAEVRLGGTVAFRDALTTDSTGRAIKATPTPGTTVSVIAYAGSPGVEGDVIPVLVAPGLLHTPAA